MPGSPPSSRHTGGGGPAVGVRGSRGTAGMGKQRGTFARARPRASRGACDAATEGSRILGDRRFVRRSARCVGMFLGSGKG
jgi:hypothetical protein